MLDALNFLLWISIIIILFFLSVKLTIQSNFVQFRFIRMINSLKKKNKKKGINNVQSLMVALGGKAGVGSISGVAIAIYYGGTGTIFWMMIITILISVFVYYEVYLGNEFKELDERNIYRGGPSYYIKKGLKNNLLSIVYTILIVICYNCCFVSIQANTIMKVANTIFGIKPILIGLIISVLTIYSIKNGIKMIVKISNLLVPIMMLIYTSLAIYTLIKNIQLANFIIKRLIYDAFNVKSFLSSFVPMIISSFQRTIFATESGLGTTAIAASTTFSDSKSQGYIQLFGIYITTFIICLSTSIILLTSNYTSIPYKNINGIELVLFAFKYHFGIFGNAILFLIVLLFCFSTIIYAYYNGESSIKSLNIRKVKFLKIITFIIIFVGMILNPTLLWNIADILIGIIILINVYSVYRLKNIVRE